MFWDICTSIARLTKQPKLVPDVCSKSVLLYQAVGTQANVAKIPSILQVKLKRFVVVCLRPHGLVQKDGFTANIWYKLRLLSQPSNTRTNIPKHASGPIS